MSSTDGLGSEIVSGRRHWRRARPLQTLHSSRVSPPQRPQVVWPPPPQDLQAFSLCLPLPLQVEQRTFPFEHDVQRFQPRPPQGPQPTFPDPRQFGQPGR